MAKAGSCTRHSQPARERPTRFDNSAPVISTQYSPRSARRASCRPSRHYNDPLRGPGQRNRKDCAFGRRPATESSRLPVESGCDLANVAAVAPPRGSGILRRRRRDTPRQSRDTSRRATQCRVPTQVSVNKSTSLARRLSWSRSMIDHDLGKGFSDGQGIERRAGAVLAGIDRAAAAERVEHSGLLRERRRVGELLLRVETAAPVTK